MWVKLIDLSELRLLGVPADLLADMRKDGLTFHGTNWGAHIIAVTTDNPWLAKKWEMSALSEQEGLTLTPCDLFPKETLLDRFAKISPLNFLFLFVAAVLVFAWFLYHSPR